MKTALLVLLSFVAFPVMAATGFSPEQLIWPLVYLVLMGLVFWLLWWFIGYIGLPEPFNKVARVLIGLVALLILIYFIFGYIGPMPHR
jgi:hypothetical protein